ncbi:acyltransferase family protein [Flavobacterium macrobrachii]|jgi:exopolysaccharide production protein ExoZ|uniref:acyltransferase family protein n=1 Tax=Flavobacterium macrobrachii TaxID=591204 RepID=UPI0037BE5776
MNKLISVQFLRAFASVYVLVTHVFQHLGFSMPGGYFLAGAYGVDLFFIISGFLIYLTTKEFDSWKSFGIKRFFRIYPLYWFSFFMFAIFYISQQDFGLNVMQVIQNIVMIPWNDELTTRSLLVNVAWSTVYEVYFYVVFTFLLFLKWSKKAIIPLLLILFAITKAITVLNLFGLNDSGIFRFISSVAGRTHIIPFIIGILIAMIYQNKNIISTIKKNQKIGRIIFVAFNMIYVVITITQYAQYKSYLFSTLIFIFWLYVDYLFEINYETKLSKFMSLIGDISYSIYLLHILVILFIIDVLKQDNLYVALIGSVAITLLLSYATYRFLEKPFIDKSKYLVKKYNF